MLYIGYKVYKIVKFKDKSILSMIFFLNLEIMSKLIFYGNNAYLADPNGSKDRKLNPVYDITSLIMPVVYLTIAIIINLRNWIYYHIKIGEMAFHSQYQVRASLVDDYLVHLHRNRKKYERALDCTTNFLIVLCLFAIGGVAIYSSCTCLDHLASITMITGYVYACLGFSFGITGCFILRRLKIYFPQFYDENRKMIVIATYALTFTICLRGIVDLLNYYCMAFDDFTNNHVMIYNCFVLIFCDMVPICF